MNHLWLILICAVVAGTGYVIGFRFGQARGRDEQWIADFLSAARNEAARRDKLGRFKAKGAE